MANQYKESNYYYFNKRNDHLIKSIHVTPSDVATIVLRGGYQFTAKDAEEAQRKLDGHVRLGEQK